MTKPNKRAGRTRVLNITMPEGIIAEVKEHAVSQQRSVSNMVSVMVQKELTRMWLRSAEQKAKEIKDVKS